VIGILFSQKVKGLTPPVWRKIHRCESPDEPLAGRAILASYVPSQFTVAAKQRLTSARLVALDAMGRRVSVHQRRHRHCSDFGITYDR
jgi:hypothetical protein